MKKLIFFVLFSFLTGVSLRASLLFTDNLNYPNGVIENDGLWYAYSPSPPKLDAFVTNDLLILNENNADSVAAPTNGQGVVLPSGDTITYASFTINVSSLPSYKGGYFCIFKDNTNDDACKIFISQENTTAPGTYQLGIANYATSITTTGATNYPLDLATGITYQVVFSFDTNQNDSTAGATLWVNPSTNDLLNGNNEVFATDPPSASDDQAIIVSQIGFSQYTGVENVGKVNIGTTPADFEFATVPQVPVLGVQPQSTNIFPSESVTLYVAASGIDETYQWYSNSVPLGGQTAPVLSLSDVQTTATYYAVVSDAAGNAQSSNAVVTVNTTPTAPFWLSQPYSTSNSLGSTITLSGRANGTQPITYQWYFEATNSMTFRSMFGATSTNLTFPAAYSSAGTYYLQAKNSVSTTNSTNAIVVVTPVPTVSIAYLHTLMTNNPDNDFYTLGNGGLFNVQGVVTMFGELIYSYDYHTYADYFLQDTNAAPGVGGVLVFTDPDNGGDYTNTLPPVGSYMSVTGVVQQYYGELELECGSSEGGGTTNFILSSGTTNGLALPPPAAVNLPLMATNPMSAYGIGIQCSLCTLTNVYLYSSTAGAPVSGNFPTNDELKLYAFASTNTSSTSPYLEVDVYTYTNPVNQFGTNFWGQPVPGYCYQLTGLMGLYATNEALFYPQRYVDFVTSLPAHFAVGIARSNGVSQLSWPAVTGSTYSVYGATNLTGPWTQNFGLGYYPSTGAYTDTNSARTTFYRVSSP